MTAKTLFIFNRLSYAGQHVPSPGNRRRPVRAPSTEPGKCECSNFRPRQSEGRPDPPADSPRQCLPGLPRPRRDMREPEFPPTSRAPVVNSVYVIQKPMEYVSPGECDERAGSPHTGERCPRVLPAFLRWCPGMPLGPEGQMGRSLLLPQGWHIRVND